MDPQHSPFYRSLEFDRVLESLAGFASGDEAREQSLALSPSQDLVWVRDELARVLEISGLFARGGSLMAGGMNDLRAIQRRGSVPGSMLTPEELLGVMQHCRVWATLRKTLDRERAEMKLVFQTASPLAPLPDLQVALERVVSPEGTIRDSASPELNRIRRAISDQMEVIRHRIAALIPRLARQGVLREESFSIRDGRYVLPVRSDALAGIKGIIHDRSASGSTLFVEPAALIGLGNQLRQLELEERDEVERILREMTDLFRRNIDQIDANRRVMIRLDCLCAKATLAGELDAIAPIVTSGGALKILGGRHPLLALAGERSVVPLNLELGAEFTTLVISGPNAGGKSVALKCVGLLSLMTACGIPIPANPGTEMPLYDHVLSYIGDQQSLSDDLSTFTAHAQGLKRILEYATPQTLVLIDEIGAGTDPQEGSSLSIAVLEQLTARHAPTIVTTHHSALKAFAHSTPGCANGSMEFDLATFQPTYRFHPNIPGSSYALEIAGRAGLPEEIVSRAREVLGGDRNQLEGLIGSLSEKVQRYESLLAGQEKRASEVQAQEDEYRRRTQKLERREKEIKQKAVEEAQEIVKQARRTVEAIVKDIRERNADRESILNAKRTLNYELRVPNYESSDQPAAISNQQLAINNQGVAQPPFHAPEPEVLPDKEPDIGDWVKVDESDTVGEVTATSARGDRVCVAVGSVQLWVGRRRVTVVQPPEREVKVKVFAKLPEVPFELDVRGLDAPEALARVDKYLYDGAASGRERVGIIHGKGMGILSEHIRRMLKDHPLVASFRFGEYGEGDYGVTIIELKITN